MSKNEATTPIDSHLFDYFFMDFTVQQRQYRKHQKTVDMVCKIVANAADKIPTQNDPYGFFERTNKNKQIIIWVPRMCFWFNGLFYLFALHSMGGNSVEIISKGACSPVEIYCAFNQLNIPTWKVLSEMQISWKVTDIFCLKRAKAREKMGLFIVATCLCICNSACRFTE